MKQINDNNIATIEMIIRTAEENGLNLSQMTDDEIAEDLIEYTGMPGTVQQIASTVSHIRHAEHADGLSVYGLLRPPKPSLLRRIIKSVLWGLATIVACWAIVHLVEEYSK
jgi:hypothetical protein